MLLNLALQHHRQQPPLLSKSHLSKRITKPPAATRTSADLEEELKTMLVNQARLTNLLFESASQERAGPQTDSTACQWSSCLDHIMVQDERAITNMAHRVEKLELRSRDEEST